MAEVLTKEQELELIAAAKSGDVEARNRLVSANVPLAAAVAKPYLRFVSPYEADDIFSEAIIGLIKAMTRWDPGRGALSTCVSLWCRERILAYLWDVAGPLRRPRWLSALNRPPLKQEKPGRAECRAAVERASRPTLRLDMHSDLAGMPADKRPGPEEIVSRAEERSRIFEALDKLDPWERHVLCARYGFDGEPQSLRQIAETAGVSREWVRKTEHRAVGNLRRLLDPDASPPRYVAPRVRKYGTPAGFCADKFSVNNDTPAA